MPVSPRRQVPGPYEDTTCQMVMSYGTPDHQHLNTIRRFRDEVLSTTFWGRLFVSMYYAITPFVTHVLRQSKLLRAAMKYGFTYPIYRLSRTLLSRTDQLNRDQLNSDSPSM